MIESTFATRGPAGPAVIGNYIIRRMLPADAAGIANCAREVYGDTYPCQDIYEPTAITRQNESGAWISAVAVNRNGTVIGHLALEVSQDGPIGEIGMGMVLPAHQGCGLRKELTCLLIAEGKQLGIVGSFAEMTPAVNGTLHLPNHIPSFVCGLTLGLWPSSVRLRESRTEPSNQRLNFLLYFRPFVTCAPATVYVLPEHKNIVKAIYDQPGSGSAVCLTNEQLAPDGGQIAIEKLPLWQSQFIRAPRIGRNSIQQIDAAHRAFSDDAACASAYLELPLADPGTPGICRQAERLGYFFCAVGPSFFRGSDALRMQCLKQAPDFANITVAHPFGRTLLEAIHHDWQRVHLRS